MRSTQPVSPSRFAFSRARALARVFEKRLQRHVAPSPTRLSSASGLGCTHCGSAWLRPAAEMGDLRLQARPRAPSAFASSVLLPCSRCSPDQDARRVLRREPQHRGLRQRASSGQRPAHARADRHPAPAGRQVALLHPPRVCGERAGRGGVDGPTAHSGGDDVSPPRLPQAVRKLPPRPSRTPSPLPQRRNIRRAL